MNVVELLVLSSRAYPDLWLDEHWHEGKLKLLCTPTSKRECIGGN